MANTITIANSLQWAQAYVLGRSLSAFTGSEPAITAANIIIQTILGPPFTWNWNRGSVSFLTTAGIQDYSTSAASFGTIEKAGYVQAASITNVALTSNIATITAANTFSVTQPDGSPTLVSITGLTTTALNVTNVILLSASATNFTFALINIDISSTPDTGIATAGKVSEITNMVNVLGSGSEAGTPNSLAPQLDDNAGNITFRLLPTPDAIYQVTIIYQKRISALVTTTSGTWAPIPDHYSYIYQWGFLALLTAYSQDQRWTSFNQKFVGMLLGAAEGLSEDQRNIFQTAWLNSITEQQTTGMKAQQGTQSRGQ